MSGKDEEPLEDFRVWKIPKHWLDALGVGASLFFVSLIVALSIYLELLFWRKVL